MLERIRYDCAFGNVPGDREFRPSEFPLPSAKREEIARALSFVKTQLEEVGLPQSAGAANEAATYIGATRQWQFSNKQGIGRIEEIERAIQREMKANAFFFLSGNEASYFQNASLFGALVEAKFPKLSADIGEAGKCLALGRPTACVFHLMRVMEGALQEFGAKLGVALADQKNWQNILNEANKAIKSMNPKETATIRLAEAAANLYHVKLAWRNQVMHPKDTYTVEEASGILESVKVFIANVAQM